jgi:hypothetical protein
MDEIYSSKTPVAFHRTTRRCISEDGIVHSYPCGSLKCNMLFTSSCMYDNIWHLLQSFQNVWTFPQFHMIYWMSACYETEIFYAFCATVLFVYVVCEMENTILK